jgi:hypothetical protein
MEDQGQWVYSTVQYSTVSGYEPYVMILNPFHRQPKDYFG